MTRLIQTTVGNDHSSRAKRVAPYRLVFRVAETDAADMFRLIFTRPRRCPAGPPKSRRQAS
jgi:hypothetical protein